AAGLRLAGVPAAGGVLHLDGLGRALGLVDRMLVVSWVSDMDGLLLVRRGVLGLDGLARVEEFLDLVELRRAELALGRDGRGVVERRAGRGADRSIGRL